ncbi:MAG TPA: DUF308 domain-containing protein, partial [Thermomicrobiales bacterium]|nr:DUF308 domain-containing protein [Thermomicrobiales bacterium]
MQDIAKDVAQQTVPWKAGQSWWVAGIEGIVALAVGVYIMADPFGASDLIRFLIALVLLLDSAGHIVEGFRSRDLSSTPWETLRGGIGATVAVLTILSAWSDYVADDGARQMLAIGLLAYGVLGLVSLIFTYRSTGFRTAAIIADLLTIVLGILLLSASSGDTGGTRLLGAAAAVGGIALLGYSWYLR